VWNGVCGESKDVDELISPHEPKNIYNVDETGFFFGITTKSLAVTGENFQNFQRNTYSVTVWEYGRINGKASRYWKSSKTNMFQEHEN
jgi:hypothetical protein